MLKLSPLGLQLDHPLYVYHASLNALKICKDDQFKTRKELGDSKVGAGGGPNNAISMTGDLRVAQAVCIGLGAIVRISVGDLSTLELIEEFKLAAPRAYINFTNELQITTQRSVEDTIELYKLFLAMGHGTREIYDPVFFGTYARMFAQGGMSQLDNIGVVTAKIEKDSFIFPRKSSDFGAICQTRFEFAVDEFNLESEQSPNFSQHYAKGHLKPEFNQLIQIVEPYKLTKETDIESLNFVSYMKGMNEFRVWNPQFGFKQDSILYREGYHDILEDPPTNFKKWRAINIRSFYPYFENLDLDGNLSLYQGLYNYPFF